MKLFKGFCKRKIEPFQHENLPPLYVLFAAFNEEKVIEKKLISIFDTDYPLDKINVFIGSDNSTDNTNNLIEKFAAQNSNIHFFPFTERKGKSNILNILAENVSKEIATKGFQPMDVVVIMTDANVFFTKNLFYELAKNFKENRVGQVGATVINSVFQNVGIANHEQTYIQSENELKHAEGEIFGSTIGCFGACYATRLALIPSLPANILMEDFYISMHILKNGFWAIQSKEAICFEDLPDDIAVEYKRKVRISAGNFQNLSFYKSLLNPLNGKVAFCFFSHKVIRWYGPFLLAICFIFPFILFPINPLLYGFFVAGILCLGILYLIQKNKMKSGKTIPFFKPLFYFLQMNIALFEGWNWHRKGVETNVWTPTVRS